MARKSDTQRFYEAHLKSFSADPGGRAYGTFTVRETVYAVLPPDVSPEQRVCEIPVVANPTVGWFDRVTYVATVHDGVDGGGADYGVTADGRLRRRLWVGCDDPVARHVERSLEELERKLSDPAAVARIIEDSEHASPEEALSAWAISSVESSLSRLAYVVSGACSEWVRADTPYYAVEISGEGEEASARLSAVIEGGLPRTGDWPAGVLSFGADEEETAFQVADAVLAAAGSSGRGSYHDRIEVAGQSPFFAGHAHRERAVAAVCMAASTSPFLSAATLKAAEKAASLPRSRAAEAWEAFAAAWAAEKPEARSEFLAKAGWKTAVDPVEILSMRLAPAQKPADAPAGPAAG